jgi:hypothetical protein
MSKHLYLLGILLFFACARPQNIPDDASYWRKIRIDFNQIDAAGLSGPANGKVSVTYEFCIPREQRLWKEVKKIDPSAQKQIAGRGRVNCSDTQWLILGNTHQKNYKKILYELAKRPYIERIEEVFYE